MKNLYSKFKSLSKWKRFIIAYLIIGVFFGIHHYLTFTCPIGAWFCWDSGLGLFVISLLMVLLYPLKLLVLLNFGGGNL